MPTLEWIGKSKVINHHQNVPFRVLERKYSFNENGQTDVDNGSENMIIRGDNLEALKALLPRYEGRVKCIYIDPPYNTGEENWIYNDNVNDPHIREWLHKAVGKEGEDLTRHDKWLCMMYPRLKLLQKLLAEDGAIFISIDDNELANLKLVCDEIFGGRNLISTFVWEKRKNRENRKSISSRHDYILCYAKDITAGRIIKQLPMSGEALDRYSNPDNDPRGPWKSDPATAQAGHATQAQFYELKVPNGKVHDLFVKQCREAEERNISKPCVPITVLDKLQSIWKEVLPQRNLILEDSKFYATFEKSGEPVKYSANQMSDGERAVLYLSAQVLCAPKNKMLIMDEPEIHLHRSIMNRLWMALERYRPDCLFIYITHDTQFAAMHPNADKLWIKEYDGQNWKLEKIDSADLPEELLLDILGSRKNVLFVEGERNSYDTQLYTELYPNYHIVPCGSCTQVIARTKAFRNNQALHDCDVYGIIDRDFRSDYEIEKYREDRIFTINVAEVENLFIVEGLVRLIASHMAKDQGAVFEAVKKYVIEDRFAKQLNGQICEGTVAQIKYKLMCAEISKKNESEAKSSLDAAIAGINYDAIRAEQEQKFQAALQGGEYAAIIKVFNCKDISTSIGHFFEIDNKAYCSLVIALLHGDKHDDIVNALVPYLPTDIPR